MTGTPYRLRTWLGGICVAAAVLACVLPAKAVDVRIATMNVCDMAGGSEKTVSAFSNIIQRIQPDILALQECSSALEEPLTALLATQPRPLPYRAFMPNPGTGRATASSDKIAIFSAWPIVESVIVKENYHDRNAVEFMRWPLHAKIMVPGALNPLHVITLHASAGTERIDRRLWRGLEAFRVREYMEEKILGVDENDVEYVVLGDFNDSAVGRWDAQSAAASFQPVSFSYDQFRVYETNGTFGSGANFILGADHFWYVTNSARRGISLPYRTFPSQRFGDVQPVETFQTGSTSNWVTEWREGNIYRLDYILFSREIMSSCYGVPAGEIYYSPGDSPGAIGGRNLPKPGLLLTNSASLDASDHLLVFSDFHMIDEISGLTPVAILSEVVHSGANPQANYIEICNTGNGSLPLDGYSLDIYPSGAPLPTATLSLDGTTLSAGEAWWVAAQADEAASAWGTEADAEWTELADLDGNDTIVLRDGTGRVLDIYGTIGGSGDGLPWRFANAVAVRIPGITEPLTSWQAVEWQITEADLSTATPGQHIAVAEADASLRDVAVYAAEEDAPEPTATDPFRFGATVWPNIAASNLSLMAVFRVDGGAWLQAGMSNVAGRVWASPSLDVARLGGSTMNYYVALSFDGPGGMSPVHSATNTYQFRGGAVVTNLTDVLINEIKSSGNANEFVELAGGAGVDVGGWSLSLYDSAATELWQCVLPDGSRMPTNSFHDVFTNTVGFLVLAPTASSVSSGTILRLDGAWESDTAGMVAEKDPRVLVLRDADGAVADAVALASTNDFVKMTMPEGLSTSVARGEGNFLHCLGAGNTTSTGSIQAPNNVRTGCTDPNLHALPDWSRSTATPGARNIHQTSGNLVIARVDSDGDGVLDDADNCPSEPNTVQGDIDKDGYGDACDEDMDGDGIPNPIDNCPDTYNTRQEDYNGDGIGNACDPDFDEEDWNGRVETILLDFETVQKTRYADSDVTTGGRVWTMHEAIVSAGTDSANDRKIGERAMRTRTNAVLTLKGTLTNGLETISFFYGPYGTDKTAKLPTVVVEASTDGGKNWKEYAHFETANTEELAAAVATGLGIPDKAGFRLRMEGGNNTVHLNLDNILLVSELAAAPTCELVDEVVANLDGQVHTNNFVVRPSRASWSVLYTSEEGTETAAPTEVGTYTATVTVEAGAKWPAKTFTFPGSLQITEEADSFAQWLCERFGATPDDPDFLPEADADNDRMTTWQEYLADTCPTDAASVLRIEHMSLSPTQMLLRFNASTNRHYRLVYWTNLFADPSTNDLGPGLSTGEITLPITSSNAWFGAIRALLPPAFE